MKAKTIKARVMPCILKKGKTVCVSEPGTRLSHLTVGGETVSRAFVLPATREAYEGMVEQMGTASDAYFDSINHDEQSYVHKNHMGAILAALNIKEPKA